MDARLKSRELESILDISPPNLTLYADNLGMPAHGAKGKARTWSTLQAVSLHIARQMVVRGFSLPLALQIANAVENEIEWQVNNEASGGRSWAAVWAGPDGDDRGIEIVVTRDTEKFLDVIDARPGAFLVDVRGLAKKALVDILEYERAKTAEKNGKALGTTRIVQ